MTVAKLDLTKLISWPDVVAENLTPVARLRRVVTWVVVLLGVVFGIVLAGLQLSSLLSAGFDRVPWWPIAGFLLTLAGTVWFILSAAGVLAVQRPTLEVVARMQITHPGDHLVFYPEASAAALVQRTLTTAQQSDMERHAGNDATADELAAAAAEHVQRLTKFRDMLGDQMVIDRFRAFLPQAASAATLAALGVGVYVAGYVHLANLAKAAPDATVLAINAPGTVTFQGAVPSEFVDCATTKIPLNVVFLKLNTVAKPGTTQQSLKATVLPMGGTSCAVQTRLVTSENATMMLTGQNSNLNAIYVKK